MLGLLRVNSLIWSSLISLLIFTLSLTFPFTCITSSYESSFSASALNEGQCSKCTDFLNPIRCHISSAIWGANGANKIQNVFKASIFKLFEPLVIISFLIAGSGLSDFFNTSSRYPAYDIVKTGENKYDVEVALAGFNKKDIKVEFADGQLSIESIKNQTTKEKDNGKIYKGIAKWYFKKSFSIADNCEVKGAELKDGLLKVSLERIIPEAQKPKVIEIK